MMMYRSGATPRNRESNGNIHGKEKRSEGGKIPRDVVSRLCGVWWSKLLLSWELGEGSRKECRVACVSGIIRESESRDFGYGRVGVN